MTISQLILALTEVQKLMGDVDVALMEQGEDSFGFAFEFTVCGVGMPNEDETKEIPVCALMLGEIDHEIKKPILKVVQ